MKDCNQEIIRITLGKDLDASAVCREIFESLEKLGSESESHALIILDCSAFNNQSDDHQLFQLAKGIVEGAILAGECMPIFSLLDRVPIFAVVTKVKRFVFQLRDAQIEASRPFELLCVADLEQAQELTKAYLDMYQQLSQGRILVSMKFETGPPPISFLLQAILNEFYIGRKVIDFFYYIRKLTRRRSLQSQESEMSQPEPNPAQVLMPNDLEHKIFNRLARIYGPLNFAD